VSQAYFTGYTCGYSYAYGRLLYQERPTLLALVFRATRTLP